MDQIITFKNPKLGPDNNFTAYIYMERESEQEEREATRREGSYKGARHPNQMHKQQAETHTTHGPCYTPAMLEAQHCIDMVRPNCQLLAATWQRCQLSRYSTENPQEEAVRYAWPFGETKLEQSGHLFLALT